MASQGYTKDKLQKMMAMASSKLNNCSGVKKQPGGERCPLPIKKEGPVRDVNTLKFT